MNKHQLLQNLIEIEVIKHGDFILKSGQRSSVYIDLRQMIAYPSILNAVSQMMWAQVSAIPCETICGVPYNAIPIATCISVAQNKPMLIKRKEIKDYGTKKQVEGKFTPGQKCLIIEDVVTTGSSILETIEILEKEKIVITDIVVLVEREKSARETLQSKGYQLHSVFTLDELMRD